jgi:hypothetical protein
MALSSRENSALIAVAYNLNIPVDWLYNLIQFESGFNPKIKNRLSSARGLLQFIDSTARDLGYYDSLDLVNKNPSIESQLLGPVYHYLKKHFPFTNRQSLYMSVFYPSARLWPLNSKFPQNVVDKNPGIVTVGDYVRKVDKVASLRPLPYVLAIVAAAWLLFKTRKRKE